MVRILSSKLYIYLIILPSKNNSVTTFFASTLRLVFQIAEGAIIRRPHIVVVITVNSMTWGFLGIVSPQKVLSTIA